MPHTSGMRLSCDLCIIIVALIAICGGIYAFSGFNILLFLCFGNSVIYRSALASGLVAALFSLYSLIVFRPFKGLK